MNLASARATSVLKVVLFAAGLVPLARLLLSTIGGELGRPGLELSEGAMKRLEVHAWPGNVRELRNALERAAIVCDGPQVAASDIWLDDGLRTPEAPVRPLADLERDAIANALGAFDGNRKQAAEALGIGLRTLYDKLKRYEIG